MTKGEFIEKYAEKTGMTKKDAGKAVNAFFEVTAEALKAGDKVVFPGIFKAEITERAERMGKNPQSLLCCFPDNNAHLFPQIIHCS